MISKSLSVVPLHKDACNMFVQGMGVIFLLAQIIICI